MVLVIWSCCLVISKKQRTIKFGKKVADNAGRSDAFFKDTKKFILYDDDLPIDREFMINKITIVIKSVVEWKSDFNPQISLNYCSYDV